MTLPCKPIPLHSTRKQPQNLRPFHLAHDAHYWESQKESRKQRSPATCLNFKYNASHYDSTCGSLSTSLSFLHQACLYARANSVTDTFLTTRCCRCGISFAARRASSSKSTVRQGRPACWRANQIQLCMGKHLPPSPLGRTQGSLLVIRA